MDQAKNWEEFREACNYSHIPGENMMWADQDGNIGWQAVGIAPIRRNFSGLVPFQVMVDMNGMAIYQLLKSQMLIIQNLGI